MTPWSRSEREQAKRSIMWGIHGLFYGLGGMTAQEENVVAYISKLRTLGEKRYAQRQWRYLQGKNSQPDHRTFGLSDAAAQKIRIHLAGMK